MRNLTTAAIAKVRQQANVGVMGDAFADEAFCRAVVAAVARRQEIPTAHGKLQFRPTAPSRAWRARTSPRCRPPGRRARAPTPWW